MGMKALANISARNDALNKIKVCDVDSGIMHVLIPKTKCRQLLFAILYSGIHCSHLMCPYIHMNITCYPLLITHNIPKPKAIFFY